MMKKIYNENSVLGSAKWWDFEGNSNESTLQLLESGFIIGNSTCGKK